MNRKYVSFVFLCLIAPFLLFGGSIENVLEDIRVNEIEYVNFSFVDLEGELRAITLPANRVESGLKNGLKFDGSSIPGNTSIFQSDMHLEPDLETFRVLPTSVYRANTGIILCDVYVEENMPYNASPRVILKNVKEDLAERGLSLITGVEMEFYLFKDGQPLDTAKYCDAMFGFADEVKYDIMKVLIDSNIDVEKFHHEVAPGQFEIVLKYGDSLKVADNVLLAKHLIRRVAASYGLSASFAPKPIAHENGTGMHIHYSVEQEDGHNAFYAEDGQYYLSNFAKHFIAGNLAYIKEYASMINATNNSYDRLVPGYEAPIFICWGMHNRSALIRIPQVTEESAPFAARVEMRAPDPSCNPYLAFAAIASSGIDGVDQQIECPEEIGQNLYNISEDYRIEKGIETLPSSLSEALQNLEMGSFKEHFVPEFIEEYIKLKS